MSLELLFQAMKEKINITEIMYLEADANYTILHLKSGEKIISGYHLAHHTKQFEKEISFIRPNRKYAVNIDFISECKQDVLRVNQLKIPISRRRKETVRTLIPKYQVA
ncbi:two-component system, LytT family, response regulator [Spirosomataceae bacterium TFI 002]|nr:two-component system, LytT family, response regulator [Spirosomataceae bacterium TFI 002]